MRTLISKFLFIISVIAFYPSINLQASEAEPEFSISRITDVEKASSYHPLYKEYHQRVEIGEEEFVERVGKSLSFADSYYFWGISDKKGDPVAFMDGAMFPSTYSGGIVMRLDSVHISSSILKDLTGTQRNRIVSQLKHLWGSMLDEIVKDRKDIKKIMANSGEDYNIEHEIFSHLLKKNSNIVFAEYYNQK